MPRVEASVVVPVAAEVAFAVSQTQGETRYLWDNFVKSQELLDGAIRPAKGVKTLTRSKHGLTMISQYTGFNPPRQVGMKMVEGPPMFASFGGGWSFKEISADETEATWRYVFTTRPAALAPMLDRIGIAILQRDLDRRIKGFAAGCEDPAVLQAIEHDLSNGGFADG